MDTILPYLTLGLTIVIGIISFFIKRELDTKDKSISKLENRVDLLEQRVHKQEIDQEKISGRIDTIIELLERMETKLDKL